MVKAPCCDKRSGLKKGPWTAEEDQKLIGYIQKHGHGRWRIVPKYAGLRRCGKSCRLRWINYLRPDIKRGRFSFEEEDTIIQMHKILGNKWSCIAARLPGRTDNEIKNHWNTRIRRRLLQMGIDPVTHTPLLDLPDFPTTFNSSLFNSPQPNTHGNVLGDHPQTNNPDLLTSPIPPSSSKCNSMPYLPQNFLENQPLITIQDFPANMDQFSLDTTNFSSQNSMHNDEDYSINLAYNSLGFQEYSSQSFSQILYENQMFEPNDIENFGFGSITSAPSSSSTPLKYLSASYVNRDVEDDQRDDFCSNDNMFGIPTGLDIDGFI